MRTRRKTSQRQTASPSITWTDADREQLCWDAGVLNLVVTQGFRKAVTEGFWEKGYRLATISRDIEPFDYIHKPSLYMLGNQSRLGRREARKLARCVMEKIGLHPKPDECQAELTGRRLVVTVALPHWAWPRL